MFQCFPSSIFGIFILGAATRILSKNSMEFQHFCQCCLSPPEFLHRGFWSQELWTNCFQMLVALRFLSSHFVIGKGSAAKKLKKHGKSTYLHHLQLAFTVIEMLTFFHKPSFTFSFQSWIECTCRNSGTEENTGSHEFSEQYPEDSLAGSLSSWCKYSILSAHF